MSSMYISRIRTHRLRAMLTVAVIGLTPSLSVAQEAPQPDDQAGEDIIVTGTILRGAPPVGSSLISVGPERAQAQGSTTANELLATIPQVSNLFNNVPTSRLAVAVNQIQVVRPNLRNLAAEGSSSASTLVLFDGHRIAPVGVTQNAIDPDLIPGLAIERVEVVTDGGSATYGSDAVGGVINFVTRKRFDGAKVQARYGFADNYHQVDAGAIVGKDWGSGSLYAAYNYQHNDAIFGRDREWIQDVDWHSAALTPRGRSCPSGSNVQIQNTQRMFAMPTLAAGANVCDPTDDQSFVPTSTRHGAIVSLHQDLADWLTVDVRAFYGSRKSISYSPFRGSTNVTGGRADNPATPANEATARQFYYRPVPGESATATETVFFTFAPLLGTSTAEAISEFKEWGANAEFRADLSDNWQLRTLFNYSRSSSNFHAARLSSGLLTQYGSGTTANTAINYYNPSAVDLPLIRNAINNEQAGEGRQELLNLRAIVDGTLFTLPGGDVKVAAGYEYLYDRFQVRSVTDQAIGALGALPYAAYARKTNSLFGEVQIPFFGEDNAVPGINSVILAASVRYDHFNDFGSTVNPKVGLNYKPVSWLTFRGNYSTSFNAPSPNDQLGATRSAAQFDDRNAPFVRPGDNNLAVQGLVSIGGTFAGLRPQTASIWSLGFDMEPPFVEGLRASAAYYNVKFKDIIRQPSPNSTIYANFPGAITSSTTGFTFAQVRDFVLGSGVANGQQLLDNTIAPRCTGGVCPFYALIDFRQNNYGRVDVEGIDFSVNYRRTTSFGGIDAGLSGNYLLSRKSQSGIGAPIVDELRAYVQTVQTGTGSVALPNNANSRFSLQATLGADIGNFRAQATLNHSAGYGVVRCDTTTAPNPVCSPSTTAAPTSSGLLQDRVGAFNTVNLFFRYAVPGDSMLLKDLEFTLNVNNVFDQDPPVFKSIGASTPGYANGFTLGRLVQFGVSKRF